MTEGMADPMDLNVEDRPAPGLRVAADAMDVAQTVRAAILGEQAAWRELFRRYNPLVITTAARFRLPLASIEDVSQTVWSLLVTHLGGIREPKALPGWIVTATRNESYRVLRIDARCAPSDPTAASTHADAVDRPTAVVRRDQPHPVNTGGQHRTHPRPLSGPYAGPFPAAGRDVRPGRLTIWPITGTVCSTPAAPVMPHL
jgi:hypothetical protein